MTRKDLESTKDFDEAYDRLSRRVLWKLTSGLYVIGSHFESNYNLMTANLVVQLATSPKMVGVSVEVGSATHRLIMGSLYFSISILRHDQRELVRKFVKPTGELTGDSTLGGVEVDFCESGAPALKDCGAVLDCQVKSCLDYQSHSFFTAQVVGSKFMDDEDFTPLKISDTRMHYGG